MVEQQSYTHPESFFVCKKTMGQKALIYRHFSKKNNDFK